jgi:hypothetical protein
VIRVIKLKILYIKNHNTLKDKIYKKNNYIKKSKIKIIIKKNENKNKK